VCSESSTDKERQQVIDTAKNDNMRAGMQQLPTVQQSRAQLMCMHQHNVAEREAYRPK
jgi:hypothetical protein